jgi:hypothetical protein
MAVLGFPEKYKEMIGKVILSINGIQIIPGKNPSSRVFSYQQNCVIMSLVRNRVP